MALTQHGWVMSQMAAITEPGTYILEPTGFDRNDRARCKALLSSLSVAGKTFGMVLVNRTLTHGIGVRVRAIDKAQHAVAAAKYKPWGRGGFIDSAILAGYQRKKVKKGSKHDTTK